MRAYELQEYNRPLIEVERPLPEPGPGEVRIRVEACGVCGSDLFLQKGGFRRPLPRIPGHEAAGRVDAIGSGVSSWRIGEQAALYYISAPADDVWVSRGWPNRSPRLQRMGVDVDGAFAEFVIRPITSLVRPAREIPGPILAVLTDAVGTPLHALKRVAQIKPGETVAVIGIGGIGSSAISLAKLFGARVVAITRTNDKKQLASALGADEVVLSSTPELPAVLRELTAGMGPDVVLQCAGSAVQDRLAIDVASAGTRVVLIGASTESFTLSATDVIWRELSILGSRGFIPADIEDAIELYLSGRLDVSHLTDRIRPMREVNEALDDIRTGRVIRSVLVP